MRRAGFLCGVIARKQSPMEGTSMSRFSAARQPHAQPDAMRRIGFISFIAADDLEAKPRIAAFLQGLQQLGWSEGRNIRIDYRLARGDADVFRKQATELATLAPDVILTTGGLATERVLERRARCR